MEMSISQLVPLREAELALLRELKNEGKPVKTKELVKRVISQFPSELTPLELKRRTPSGTFWWGGRLRYDLNRLKKKGEARRPVKGCWEITALGSQILATSVKPAVIVARCGNESCVGGFTCED